MQLSVSTSPSDPLLAALLPGGETVSVPGAGAPATPFGALFPELAPSPATGSGPIATSPLAGGEIVPPTWIGSTQPQVSAQPSLPSAPRAAAPGPVVTAETTITRVDSAHPSTLRANTAVATRSSASAKPAAPLAARPSPRSPRAEVPAQPTEPNSLSSEIALALAATVPPPAAPVSATVTLLETPAPTSSTLFSDSLLAESSYEEPTAVIPRAATSARPACPASSALPASASGHAPVASAPMFAPPRSAAVENSNDLPPSAAPSAAPVAAPIARSIASPAARAVKSAAPLPATAPSSSSSVSPVFPDALPASLPLDTLSPVSAAESVVFADATRSFAPAEILSRQFAPAPRTASAPDLASAFNAPHAIAFTSPENSPVTLSPADAAVPFSMRSSDVASLPVASGFPAANSVAPAPTLPQTAVDSFLPARVNTSATPVAPAFAAATPSDSPSTASATVPAFVTAAALPSDSPVAAPREFGPTLRSERTAFSRGAKIAANAENSSAAKNSASPASGKTFVNVSSEEVVKHGTDVGTGVAKSEATMSSSFFNRSSSAAVLEHAPVDAASVVPQERIAEAAPTSLLAAEPIVAAQRAVEAVLTAVERFSDGERHSVNLSFAMGDTALDVRVELRDDAIHATFRTESPELRQALASQWQAVTGAGDSGERTLRLAAPVFTSQPAAQPAGTNFSSFAGGDGSSRQRESASRRSGDDALSVAGLRSRSPRTSSVGSVADTSAAPAAARPASPTSHRLHTLA